MLASLPMYDRPENAAAHDALWAGVRDRLRAAGVDAPDALDRATAPAAGWARDDLLLGQICNLPFRAWHRTRLRPLGCADYGLPDTLPGHYSSVFVVRADDPAASPEDADGYRFALSDPMSHSGWGAPHAWAAAHGLTLRPAIVTGAHRQSLAAVAEGRADLAAIDIVSWRMFKRWEPAAARVRIIGVTGSSPGMTFVTGPRHDPAAVLATLAAALEALDTAHRETLGLRGIVGVAETDYDLPFPPELEALGA